MMTTPYSLYEGVSLSTNSSSAKVSHSSLFRVVQFIAKGLGTGWFPKAPGTAGSVLGVVIAYYLLTSVPSLLLQIISAIGVSFLAWVSIFYYEKLSGKHDDSQVVIDEIAGILICFLGLPLNLPVLLAGFLLFRFFDIVKPFPISWADESVPGAFGTLLDDLMAGVISCVLLHFIVYWGWL